MKNYKLFKIVIGFIFISLLISGAVSVKAETTNPNNALIKSLQVQIQALLEQITQLRLRLQQTPNVSYCFVKNFSYGQVSQDIKSLQTLLGVKPVTGYFGKITLTAIKSFQQQNKIIVTGKLDLITRNKLNEKYCLTSNTLVSTTSTILVTTPITTPVSTTTTTINNNINPAVTTTTKPIVNFFDSQGNLLVNGSTYFPIGIYGHQTTKENDINTIYQKLASHGFTVSVPTPSQDYLNLLDSLGMKAYVYLSSMSCASNWYSTGDTKYLTECKQIVDSVKNHPAVLAWVLADEPDGWIPWKKAGITCDNSTIVNRIVSLEKTVKEADPYHPTTIVLTGLYTSQDFTNLGDFLSVDRYPCTAPITEVSKSIDTIKGFTQKPVWVIPQALGGPNSTYCPEHATTPQEEKAMQYLALIHNVKGIISYTYADSGFYLPDNLNLWNSYSSLNSELKTLSPIIAASSFPGISVSNSQIQYLAKTYNNELYILAVNPEKTSVQANFNLGLYTPNNSITVLFENRQLASTSSSFSDTFEPLAVHVYKMSISLVCNNDGICDKFENTNNCSSDCNNANSIQVINPSRDTILQSGSTYDITWSLDTSKISNPSALSFFSLYYMCQGDSDSSRIGYANPNSSGDNINSYSWQIPAGLNKNQCSIYIYARSSSSQTLGSAISGIFSIQ